MATPRLEGSIPSPLLTEWQYLPSRSEARRHRGRAAIGDLMALVDEQFRKCVAFLYVDVQEGGTPKRLPAGTMFFVGVPLLGDAIMVYAVTARHVVDQSRRFGPLHLRLNRRAGGFQDLQVPPDAWVTHPTTDVAVAAASPSHEEFDYRCVMLDVLATDEFVAARRVGEGDDVFFVGLFNPVPGKEQNQPIIRFGNVALMPREKLMLELTPGTRSAIDAYLVEARSWGGNSGSPAFIYFPPDREMGGGMVIGDNPIVLLGLVHGHYEIHQEIALLGDVGSGKVPVNAGIAALIPAQKITEVLMHDELVEQREKLLVELRKTAPTPKPD
jgi:hypothetical protein